jgi:DHA1 family tetracycline resistance protein-like MFS transporter
MAWCGLGHPAAQERVTPHVAQHVQGRVQGALSSLMSVAGIAAPPFYTAIFAWAIGPSVSFHLPGAPFWAAGALLVVAVAVAWRYARLRAAGPAGATEAA